MIDHLVYAAPDLSRAIDDIERSLGVRPALGGKHAGGLTHNALLSLGDASYLEIIAPVAGASPAAALPFGLGTLTQSRLAAWAVAVDDIERAVAASRDAGYDPGEVVPGGRDLPDGSRLEWRLALRPELAGDGLVPFLIQWTSEPHPSLASPRGCRLLDLRAEHPSPEAVGAMLNALGVQLHVTSSRTGRLIAILDTANGTVELS